MKHIVRSELAQPSSEVDHVREYMNEHQAAAYCNLSVAQLRVDRHNKRGIPHVSHGRRVIYRRVDIDEYMARNLVRIDNAA